MIERAIATYTGNTDGWLTAGKEYELDIDVGYFELGNVESIQPFVKIKETGKIIKYDNARDLLNDWNNIRRKGDV